MKNKFTEWYIWKMQWRHQIGQRKVRTKQDTRLCSWVWTGRKEGSASQHLVIEVERLPTQNLNQHYSSKSCPFQKTLPNQYCSNQEVKSSQEVSVWPHWTYQTSWSRFQYSKAQVHCGWRNGWNQQWKKLWSEKRNSKFKTGSKMLKKLGEKVREIMWVL